MSYFLVNNEKKEHKQDDQFYPGDGHSRAEHVHNAEESFKWKTEESETTNYK